tara:strand:- start:36 stop:851 length:816 start_codon:yes stop_codon:yes gene_type:complete
MESEGMLDDHPLLIPKPLSIDLIRKAHHPEHCAYLSRQTPDPIIQLDPDTWFSPHSLRAAHLAAGAVWDGVLDIIEERCKRVFCAVRPPGHHAEINSAMGFCLLNSVAISAINSLDLEQIDRVAILDFDVHHGNGTVDICKDRPEILVCSSFQHPWYPNRLYDLNRPNIVNTPLRSGTQGDEFRKEIERTWFPAIEKHRPNLVFISAGFDAHQQDPLSEISLTEDDFYWITSEIARLSEQYSDGRVVSVLEGGYDLESLGNSCIAHLKALL